MTRNSQESHLYSDGSDNKTKLQEGRAALEETLRGALGPNAGIFHARLLDKLYDRVGTYSEQANFEEEKEFDAEFEHQATVI